MEYKLGELVDNISETSKIKNNKVVLINTSDVENGKVLNHTYVDNKNLRGQFKKRFKKGDILYSEIRPKNRRFAYVDFDSTNYIASTKLMILRNKGKVNNKYLFLLLTSKKIIEYLQMIAESRSGTFPQITFTEVANITVNVPNIETQDKIVNIIDIIDKKIELNNQINNNLYELGDLVYKEYYLRFISDLPEGYQTKFLSEVAQNFDSKRKPISSRERELHHGKYPYYGATSIIDHVDDYIFDGTYVLMGEDGTVKTEKGNPVLQYIWGKNWINNHAHVLKGKKISTEHLYFALRNVNIEPLITGAVQPKINQENMNKIQFVIGTEDINNKFETIIKSIMDKSKQLIEENKTLGQLRNVLLPKLMNGEIDLDK